MNQQLEKLKTELVEELVDTIEQQLSRKQTLQQKFDVLREYFYSSLEYLDVMSLYRLIIEFKRGGSDDA